MDLLIDVFYDKLETGQMYLITFFLNSDLDKDFFKVIPYGFKDPKNTGLI